MRTTYLVSVIFLVISLISCRKEEHHNPGYYYKDDGTAEVKPEAVVTITDANIENNLDVKGDATFQGYTQVNTDFESYPNSITTVYDSMVVRNNFLVKGQVYFLGAAFIGTDFNQFPDSKVVIDAPFETTEIVIDNNLNIQDSLIVKRGTLIVNKDLNLMGAKGVLNISNAGHVIVKNDFNQDSQLYGKNNLTVEGTFNDNNSGGTFEEPLY